MKKSILHTPEGVQDIYGEEVVNREIIVSKLKELVKSYGYDNIQTPALEYLSVYYKDITLKRPKDLYKLFDKEGNTLVLRPDFTPSIARATTKYFTDEKIIRLFYEGNVFNNNKRYQGRLMESHQFGSELIGDYSIDADAEIIAIVVNALKSCSLNDFIISIGHADIIKELIRLGGFDENDALTITEYISNRNIFDLDKFLNSKGCNSEIIDLFSMVSKMYKPASKAWKELLDCTKDYKNLHDSLKYLDKLSKILDLYDVNDYISFEPGSDSKFDYYTGIIFAGYTKGIGESVVTGGRYDNLLSNFGNDRPAIGFGISVDALQNALHRQKITPAPKSDKTLVIYKPNDREAAIKEASELRNEGKIAELISIENDFDSIKKLYSNDNISIMEIK